MPVSFKWKFSQLNCRKQIPILKGERARGLWDKDESKINVEAKDENLMKLSAPQTKFNFHDYIFPLFSLSYTHSRCVLAVILWDVRQM